MSKCKLVPVTADNITILADINSAVLPIQYPSNSIIYKQMLTAEDFCFIAYTDDNIAIGAIGCRLELNATKTAVNLLILTIAVLAPYRRSGIGSQLLQRVIDNAKQFNENAKQDGTELIESIFLHVQVNNDEAIAFYTGKFGFSIKETLQNYYKKLVPPDAYILSRAMWKERITNENDK